MLFSEMSPRYTYSLLTHFYNLMHLHVKLGAEVFQLYGFLNTWRHLRTLIYQQTSQNHVVSILVVYRLLLILSNPVKTVVRTSRRVIIV